MLFVDHRSSAQFQAAHVSVATSVMVWCHLHLLDATLRVLPVLSRSFCLCLSDTFHLAFSPALISIFVVGPKKGNLANVVS